MRDLYSYNSYKDFLKARLLDASSPATVTELAQAGGCQRSYLSKVLSSEIHLTPEHAHGIARYLGFSGSAYRYFMTLIHHDRAAAGDYRKNLKTELETLRRENMDIATKIQAEVIQADSQMAFYYSSWIWVAIHVATSIPALRTPSALAKHFHLSETDAMSVLEQLEALQLVQRRGSTWTMTDKDLHLHRASPFIGIHHQNWRQKAVLSSQLHSHNNIHYTTVSSISRSDCELLKEKVIKFIENSRKFISSSKEESLICMNFDCFDV